MPELGDRASAGVPSSFSSAVLRNARAGDVVEDFAHPGRPQLSSEAGWRKTAPPGSVCETLTMPRTSGADTAVAFGGASAAVEIATIRSLGGIPSGSARCNRRPWRQCSWQKAPVRSPRSRGCN